MWIRAHFEKLSEALQKTVECAAAKKGVTVESGVEDTGVECDCWGKVVVVGGLRKGREGMERKVDGDVEVEPQ